MPYTVAIHASVLVPRASLVHIALVRLAAEQLFVPRWNEGIMDDLRRRCDRVQPGEASDPFEKYIAMLHHDFEDAMSRPRQYVTVGPFPIDIEPEAQHVLEAVVTGQASTIVTTTPDDFPEELIRQWGTVVQDIDDFLCSRLQLQPRKLLGALDRWIARNCDRNAGPLSMGELIGTLSTEVPNFAKLAMLRMDPGAGEGGDPVEQQAILHSATLESPTSQADDDALTPVAVYLSDADAYGSVREAVDAYLAASALDLVEDDDPVIGSVWWSGKAKKRAAETAQHAGVLAETTAWGPARSRQADNNLKNSEAAVNLVQALSATEKGVIQIGSLLAVRRAGSTVVITLSEPQVNELARRPALLRDPESVLEHLENVGTDDDGESQPGALGS